MKSLLVHVLVIAAAVTATYYVATHHTPPDTPAEKAASARKLLYYQSPMHPWVKSDKPGRCTVCGMELVPVYEGEKGFQSQGQGIVMLPPGNPNALSVQTTEVKRQPLVRTMRVAGMVDDDDSRHRVMSAYTRGRIQRLFVNYDGAEVHEGEPLALFYSPDLLSAARDYALAARQGGAGLQQASATRLLQLGLTKDQISKVPQRKDDDLYFEILAPMNGTVVKRNVYEGQYVDEGAPLFELADFSHMWFQFIAYEQDLPFLRVGQAVDISTPSLPGKVIHSAISFINPNLDELTRSARVRVEIENITSSEGLHRGHEILHKLYAEALVHVEAPEVLAIPRQAVLWPGTGARCYVELQPGAYQQRQIRLGRVGDTHWEILDGLQGGERVVLTANMLIDGQAQLDAMAAAPAPPASFTGEKKPPPQAAVIAYLRAADAVNAALADDDLAAANAALAKLPPAPPDVGGVPTPASATDLKDLRKAFLPWSQEIARLASALRPALPDLRIFRCPMTSDLWSGAPANAQWIQFSTELRNPYWGREMRDCGAEVKP